MPPEIRNRVYAYALTLIDTIIIKLNCMILEQWETDIVLWTNEPGYKSPPDPPRGTQPAPARTCR